MDQLSPAEVIARESPARIDDYFSRPRDTWNPTGSLTALTEEITQEYEDRFLVELIQNAYDAHPRGTVGGEIRVRIDESQQVPVLYVANAGRPFAIENFTALTNLARSSKPPGEGIGNKGVGFRSVFRVCEFPTFFSCSPDDPADAGFNGFCFGFATDEQIRSMVDSEDDYTSVQADFSRYLLPVTAPPDDPQLDAFRSNGMVTVLRLPLLTNRAVELVRAQVELLLEPGPPIALFLARLDRIVVEVVDEEGSETSTIIDRRVEAAAGSIAAGVKLEWVTTGGQRFLMATQLVPEASVIETIRRSIEAGDLNQKWASWTGDTEVSLAVPLSEGQSPSVYTYLPMRVPSPLHAHIHAPFHTRMARLDLNEGSTFNVYFLEAIAALCVVVLDEIRTGSSLDLTTTLQTSLAVDLLCWDRDHLPLVRDALLTNGSDLQESNLVPSRGGPEDPSLSWACLNDVYAWEERDLKILTSERIGRTVPLVHPDVPAQQLARLGALHRVLYDSDLEPNDATLGEWVESIAADLHESKVKIKTWNLFYYDVASLFDARSAKTLQQRKILLDEKNRLLRAGPWSTEDGSERSPIVFIPARSSGFDDDGDQSDEDLRVPKGLQRAISFLHEGIEIRLKDRRRTAIAELLEDNGRLVERFDLRAILTHIRRILGGKPTLETRRQALGWVYRQERSSRADFADLDDLGLHVPTTGGWRPAKEAVLSKAWGTPRARSLQRLISSSAEQSPSLAALGDRMILDPTAWPFKVPDVPDVRDFLLRCGVHDGLMPVPLRARGVVELQGRHYTPERVASRFAYADGGWWREHVNEDWTSDTLVGPQTPYRADAELWTLPGEDGYERFDSLGRDLFAAAILDAVGDWPEHVWRFGFRRMSSHHSNKRDPQVWPSPVAAFVARAPWFPMADVGSRDDHYFVPTSSAWTFDEATDETAPRFAPLAPVDQRRRISDSDATQGLLAPRRQYVE